MTRVRYLLALLIPVLIAWLGTILTYGLVSHDTVLFILAIVAIAAGAWKVSGAGGTDEPVPWTQRAMVGHQPESVSTEGELSSAPLTAAIERAGERARQDDIEAGIATVRPLLRETLVEALVAGGTDRSTADDTVTAGSWTDDEVAASVLEQSIQPTHIGLRRRLWEWLFPERAVRWRVGRAVTAMLETAETSVPTVPGQTAPRPRPTVRPPLGERIRAPDGSLSATGQLPSEGSE